MATTITNSSYSPYRSLPGYQVTGVASPYQPVTNKSTQNTTSSISPYRSLPQGSVLGESTSAPPAIASGVSTKANTSPASKPAYFDDAANIGYYNGQIFTDKNQWLNASGQSGGNANDYNGLIDQTYNEGLSALSNQEKAINEANQGDTQTVQNQADQQQRAIEQENQTYNESLDTSQKKFNDTIETALNSAIKAFNALRQQGGARFGAGSSAGQAVGELAQQEFFRQQGDINKKQAEGTLAFEQEKNKVKQFIGGKLTDLQAWKDDALNQLKSELNNRLNDISSKKYELAANRNADKMNILTSIRDKATQIAETDKEFRKNLALATVSKMQELAQRVYTPKEINAVLSEFGIATPSFTSVASVPTTKTGGIYNPNAQDELNVLNPLQQTAQTAN